MSVKKNIVANYLGQAWVALMGLAFVPVYIHYLGVEAWGLVGFMAMLQAWLTLLDVGLTPTLSREMARFRAGAHSAQSIRDLLRSLEVIFGAIAVLIVSIIWFLAPWLSTYWLRSVELSDSELSHAIVMIGFVLAARMAEQVYRGAIQGLQRQVWLNGVLAVMATFRWAGVVGVLAWIESSIELFFLWQGVISLVTVVILARKTYRLLTPGVRPARFEISAIRKIRRFAGGMAVTTLLTLLLTQVDKLLLSKMVSLEEFGYYMLAASVAGGLAFLVGPIATAIQPRLTELVTRSEDLLLVEIYHRASQWLAVILIPVALLLAVFSDAFLYMWTGSQVISEKSGPLLTLISLGTMCNGFMHVPYNLQLAYGWTGLVVRVNIVAVIVIVPAILWAVPAYGAIGAAWAWLFLNAGYVLIGIHYIHRRLIPREKWRWYADAVFKPLIVGVITMLTIRYSIDLPKSRGFILVSMILIAVIGLSAVLLAAPCARKTLFRKLGMHNRGVLWLK